MSYETIIATATLLMILSQITERFANFLKLWLSGKQLNPFGDTEPTRVRNLRVPAATATGGVIANAGAQDMEKEREEGILFLNMLCGWAIAWGTIASLNATDELPDGIQWIKDAVCGTQLFLVLIGGFFLSFGSKFWHDLLDLLFQYKRAKEQIIDPVTYQQDSIADLESHLKTTSQDAARKALELKGAELRARDGVVAVGVGVLRLGGATRYVIEIHLRDEESARGIEKELVLEMNGRVVQIPVVTIITGVARLMAGGAVGGRIRNSANAERTGTMGCVVRDRVGDRRYLLSCYHVMRNNHDWSKFRPGQDEQIQSIGNGVIGELFAGGRTSGSDAAIALISPGAVVDRSLPEGKRIAGWRKLTDDDEAFQTKVWFKGANHDTLMSARIHARKRDTVIAYPDGDRLMEGLVVITDRQGGQLHGPTLPGDSGAVAFDKDGKAVGMVVAGDDRFSYLIPIGRVLSTYDLEIET